MVRKDQKGGGAGKGVKNASGRIRDGREEEIGERDRQLNQLTRRPPVGRHELQTSRPVCSVIKYVCVIKYIIQLVKS